MAGRCAQGWHGKSKRRSQHGAALLIFLVLLVMAGLTYVINSFSPEALQARRIKKTQEALVLARDALIGYAVQYREQQATQDPPVLDAIYGYLPLPDFGESVNLNHNLANQPCITEGCAMINPANLPAGIAIGRFPWLTLGTGPLRDGHGECLWYAVSTSHRAINPTASTMNWDTLAVPDILIGSGLSDLSTINVHDRPIAVVFSPGAAFDNGRITSEEDAPECGGNYDPTHYINPAINNMQSSLAIAPDKLFERIRQSTAFRQDINTMLSNMANCLGDSYKNITDTGGVLPSRDKLDNMPINACYGNDAQPLGYYDHYKEIIFVVPGNTTVNGQSCLGTLLFAGQRSAGKSRSTATEKAIHSNYLEDPNLDNYSNAGTVYSGPDSFERASITQTASQDIVRCIQPTFSTVNSSALAASRPPQLASAQFAAYDAATSTLTLGQTVGSTISSAYANNLFGCAWRNEVHNMNGGVRAYFKFRINDYGFSSSPHEGFAFAIVDADHNGMDACGGAAQHMGYSGNNLETPYIAPPKIAVEIDPRREGTFNPSATNTLTNGRNDPSSSIYPGGHVAFVYWGGETAIATGTFPPCVSPRMQSGSACYLQSEEDDNVHGLATSRSGFPAPPTNPVAPASPLSVPPDEPQGVYKLDPQLSQVPINREFHVRVELTRQAAATALPRARVATTGALSLALPGTSIDGVALFAGDRVLVKNQANAAENGLYVWNGNTTPLVRATDADSAIEVAGLIVEVLQGAINAHTIWRQSIVGGVLETDALRWAPASVKLYAPASTNLSNPGARLDGILMKAGDRVLVANAGVYMWNGAAVPMTPVTDTTAVEVRQGSEATAWWQYNGASWQRSSVRVASQDVLDLNNPGATIDAISLAAGDRVLLKAQSNPTENGIYVWSGPNTPLVRASDADTPLELAGAIVRVLAGTDVGRAFRQSTLAAGGTLDSDAVAWMAIDGASKYLLETWILPDSPTTANQIAAMKNTTRPMNTLYPDFDPHLRDRPTIAYPFRNARLGFTTGQRTSATDQTLTISNHMATWIE